MKRIVQTLVLCLGTAVLAQSPSTTSDGFALPQSGRVFSFPRDHGSHPDFRTEWWYVTGHLDAANGERFGFQATFFRQASPARQSLYLAHATLLDVQKKTFINEERLNREGWDAGASTTTLDVHNGNWSMNLDQDGVIHLNTTIRSDAKLSLKLTSGQPLVVFGKDGVSKKGTSPEAASHYLTFPRLDCVGTVGDVAVSGQAWMDHEFSSSQLDRDQVGWDWASLQLNDGTEIMAYRMRRQDGTSDPAGTTLARISKTGTVEQIDHSRFSWERKRTWTSPSSGAAYPVEVLITTKDESFHLIPLFDAQELKSTVSSLPYWEGACEVKDSKGVAIGQA
ncbi:MAG: hypothetical protein JWO89_1218, partial [Verrucomicrobiaceae bacterium]|nr:hypothetical protein [Verrucomicrobiaceae bacterium]